MFGTPKENFLVQKPGLILKYMVKRTNNPRAGEKRLLFQKNLFKKLSKNLPKNPSKKSFKKNMSKNLFKFMNLLKNFSDYPFTDYQKRVIYPRLRSTALMACSR